MRLISTATKPGWALNWTADSITRWAKRKKDDARSSFLTGEGITVVRFWNNEVLRETEGVMEELLLALSPTLSQRERERVGEDIYQREGMEETCEARERFPSPPGKGKRTGRERE